MDLAALRLSPEEGFVLSRLDVPLSVRDLVAMTGIEEARVVQIVEGLALQGAVEIEGDPLVRGSLSSAPPHAPLRSHEDDGGIDSPEPIADVVEEEVEEEGDAEEAERRAAGAREYHRIYETVFHTMPRDARAAAASNATGENLLALCFDPDPVIIAAILTNPSFHLDHARLIATHHRTHAGLDLVGRRNECLSDTQVQRRLLANPQLPDSLLRKIVQSKLLSDVYKIAVNREIPERSRLMTRELLQKKFLLATPDERASLLFRTEARCLLLLVNCALDARTTQILISRSSYTVLFIQNFARWSATPPALLMHMLRQPLVRQNVGLRKQLLRHRNVPSEAKRNLS